MLQNFIDLYFTVCVIKAVSMF